MSRDQQAGSGSLGWLYYYGRDRASGRDAARVNDLIGRALGEGQGVVLFPEGTSTRGEEVLKFNSSFLEFAAQTDLPVHYVSITYQTPHNTPPANTVCWWMAEDTLVGHMWRLFQIPEFTAIVNFGEAPVQSPNRKELSRRLWEKVREKFIPVL